MLCESLLCFSQHKTNIPLLPYLTAGTTIDIGRTTDGGHWKPRHLGEMESRRTKKLAGGRTDRQAGRQAGRQQYEVWKRAAAAGLWLGGKAEKRPRKTTTTAARVALCVPSICHRLRARKWQLVTDPFPLDCCRLRSLPVQQWWEVCSLVCLSL